MCCYYKRRDEEVEGFMESQVRKPGVFLGGNSLAYSQKAQARDFKKLPNTYKASPCQEIILSLNEKNGNPFRPSLRPTIRLIANGSLLLSSSVQRVCTKHLSRFTPYGEGLQGTDSLRPRKYTVPSCRPHQKDGV